ncbi:16S rRNA (uracil(1498)-N(3))-methyltransferase [Mycoplasma yeatsii]|uniref:16S rRNA (uracil(1498)-N(3))-methyltransferase n=1 Tax=Mycoplasma yeatsii TaxID=51365 RepID=UPI0005B24CED|nr:16S rRNA (uracil(1498)-N(3))-methyltransferase [Mycoplasma yeatsii]AJM71539.1 16S ribosomal RNA methyltransferase RsmE [Mycoplasma yeatsii GM274B]
MHRFFCNNKFENHFILDDDLMHHIKVARLENDEFLTNYDGVFFKCKLQNKTNIATIIEKLDINHEYRKDLVLAAPIIKIDRFEWMIEKATELGVKTIHPMISQFCNHKLVDFSFSDKKMIRYETKIKNASEQSFRNIIPVITKPLNYQEIIKKYLELNYTIYIAHEQLDSDLEIDQLNTNSVLIAGPEGGLSDKEIEFAKSLNDDRIKFISLGKTILRAETASIKMLSKVKE